MKKIIFTAAFFAVGTPCVLSQTETPDTISSQYTDLDELVITAKKNVIKSDGASVTYDMEQDDSSRGMSLLDALRKIPTVTVDGQDNIRVKGDSNFKIYVNGKEDPMLTANASKLLKMMPADAVSRVEVILEPGAKYDAEGTGGIINLVTQRKQSRDGYTGTVDASAMSIGFLTGGVYGRMKKNRITADANISLFGTPFGGMKGKNSTERISESDPSNYRQLVKGSQKTTFQFIDASLNLSWEPTDHDLFSFGGSVRDGSGKIKKFDPVTSMWNSAGVKQFEYRQIYGLRMSQLSAGGNLSYQHSFNEEGHRLLAAYRFDFGSEHSPMKIETENILNYPVMGTPMRFMNTDQHNYSREHTAQIDYAIPFAHRKHLFETGVKGIFRRNTARGETFSGADISDMSLVSDQSTLTNQYQDIYALYAEYTGIFQPVTVVAGVRYEHTRMGMNFLRGSNPDFESRQNDVVPNLSVVYSTGAASNLRLAYQTRIQRPALWQTNPFRQQSIPTEIKVGNPDLESERFNSVSLTYSNFGRTVGGNIGLTYKRSDNAIERYLYFKDGIRYETYDNIGINSCVDLSGFLNWNITPRMTVTANGMASYVDLRAGHGSHMRNHGWSGNYGLNWNYTDPVKIKYTVYGGQSFRNIRLQGDSNGYYYYGLSLSRGFLKNDQLSVTLSTNNFCQKWMSYKQYSNADGYKDKQIYRNPGMNFGVAVTWKFGHLDDTVKKGAIEISNDDIHAKESGKGGISL